MTADRTGDRTDDPSPHWRRRLLKISGFTVLGGLLVLVVLFLVAYLTIDVPAPNAVVTAQSTVLYYADGTTKLGTIGKINRQDVPLDQVSVDLQHAVLAAEDRNYYSEPGISPTGIARALWADVTGGDVSQGGSTITQQYAKNAFLSQERTFTRKFKEIIIAIKLDHAESKSEVLESYLNVVYFGRGAYGVQAAAQTFFGVDASKVTPAQGALLAVLVNAPSLYDPATHPDAARARWHYVLDGMVSQHWLSPQAEAALTFPTVKPIATGNSLGGPQGYLITQARAELAQHGFTSDALTRGGYQITTTINPAYQADAVKAVTGVLGDHPPGQLLSPFVALAPGTGAILAEYAGADYVKRQLNAVTGVHALPGSSFKPVVLAAALAAGKSLYDTYDGSSPRCDIPGYAPPNCLRNDAGDPPFGRIDLIEATAQSVNTVYVPLAIDVGVSRVRTMANNLGFPEDFGNVEGAIALGTVGVEPIEQAGLYATFAAQGRYAAPYLVAKVVGPDGQVVYAAKPRPRTALSGDVSANATTAMLAVVDHGTGTAAQLGDGQPAAGKTGTTTNNRAAWFCGYTPQVAAVSALFFTDNSPITDLSGVSGGVYGGTLPAKIWKSFVDRALNGAKIVDFPAPSPASTPSPTPPSTAPMSLSPTPAASPPRPSPSPSPTPSPTPSPSPAPSPSPSVSSPPPSATRSPTPPPSPTPSHRHTRSPTPPPSAPGAPRTP